MLKKFIFPLALLFSFSHLSAQGRASSPTMRIIMIGAHPDDCDNDGGGTAILLASMGHAVKFVSVTNGDAGHQTRAGVHWPKVEWRKRRKRASDLAWRMMCR